MYTCDRHDDSIVVFDKTINDCPICEMEEELSNEKAMRSEFESQVESLQDELGTANDTIAELNETINNITKKE